MKYQNELVAIIISVTLLASAMIISSSLATFGKDMRDAAASIANGLASQRAAVIPSNFRLDLGEIKIANGGGGESFRIHTANQ